MNCIYITDLTDHLFAHTFIFHWWKSTTQGDAHTHSHRRGTANLGSGVLLKDTSACSLRRHPSPASTSCIHYGWNLNSGHQVKRVRAENIIKAKT